MNYTNKESFFLNKKQKDFFETVKSKMQSTVSAELFDHLTGTLLFSEKLAIVHLFSNVKKFVRNTNNLIYLTLLFFSIFVSQYRIMLRKKGGGQCNGELRSKGGVTIDHP